LKKDFLGIPSCKSVHVEVGSQYAVQDVRISSPLSATATTNQNNLRVPAYVVNNTLEPNAPYALSGVAYSHPKNSTAILLVDKSELIEDSVYSYQPDTTSFQELHDTFAPEEDTVESIHARLQTLYDDLAYNVTGIYGRGDMQFIMDLTWHSPLFFRLEGRRIKGWLNSIIVGDSGQGKSEMASTLLAHYGVGERVECKNASAAGLIGGLQQMGTRWFVSWGVIPQNDRRMVILEEAKGLQVQEIAKMTDMRSSGVAELPKIEHGRANARTRLMFISNPRSQRNVGSFSYGLQSITTLIGALEDTRRFDIAAVVSLSQVDPNEINKKRADRKSIEHRATHERCRSLVLLAWTRDVDDIIITEKTEDEIQRQARRLSTKFSDAVPLLDRGTTKEKVARLSAALAARLASYDSDFKLVVKPCHVEYVAGQLDRIYSDPIFGYLDYSEAKKQASAILAPGYVRQFLRETKFPLDVVTGLMRMHEITVEDIQSLLSVDRDLAMDAISTFVRKHCIVREGRSYRKTEAFIDFLRELLAEGLPEVSDTGVEF